MTLMMINQLRLSGGRDAVTWQAIILDKNDQVYCRSSVSSGLGYIQAI